MARKEKEQDELRQQQGEGRKTENLAAGDEGGDHGEHDEPQHVIEDRRRDHDLADRAMQQA
jgi:hypothetical protein